MLADVCSRAGVLKFKRDMSLEITSLEAHRGKAE